jgi:hypothetical protein
MSRLFFSSIRMTTRSSSRMNTHDDEWTRCVNKMNEQNKKEWKWRKKKWWKKDELWLKNRANFILFWSRISVLRNENNTWNENFNNFILCLHFMSSYHVFMSFLHVISSCHFFMSFLHVIFSYDFFISRLYIMFACHVFSSCLAFCLSYFSCFWEHSFRVWRWIIYSLDDIMIDKAIDKIWF